VSVCLLAACREAPDDLLLVGTIERTLVELTAPASEPIVGVSVRRGQRVAKGDPLVQLDTIYALADVAKAEANLAAASTARMSPSCSYSASPPRGSILKAAASSGRIFSNSRPKARRSSC
jgi:multidrug efflux pump subunit AcrA (membrane-fusion protein)